MAQLLSCAAARENEASTQPAHDAGEKLSAIDHLVPR
jgi:hypothetical protein